MNKDIKIIVDNLSKVFLQHKRQKVKGIATDGLAALNYLLKRTLRPKTNSFSNYPASNFFLALDKINFDVKAGEVLGIIGRNGAGKTTLLKILARILEPSAGRVTLKGKVMSMLELGIGFAPELTVRENIHVQGRLAGIKPKQIQAAEENILSFAELTQYRDLPLGKCPSGSFTQLGFAAMINFNIDIILADEVLAVGDARFRQRCEERVIAAGQSGESVLFVSHDMNAIRRICSRVIWIDRGKVIAEGPTQQIVKAYTDELLSGRLLPPLTESELTAACRLLDIRLLDANQNPIGALQITEDAYIDCLIRITRPDVAITVELELWQQKHCLIAEESQHSLIATKVSTFSISIKIPGNLLNELSYQICCKIWAANINEPHLPRMLITEKTLDFTVMNSRPHESAWSDWEWGRPGLISPKLPWSMKMNEI